MTLNMVVHISPFGSQFSGKLSPERNDGIGILEVFCAKWLSKHEYWKRDVSSLRNILFQIIDTARHCKEKLSSKEINFPSVCSASSYYQNGRSGVLILTVHLRPTFYMIFLRLKLTFPSVFELLKGFIDKIRLGYPGGGVPATGRVGYPTHPLGPYPPGYPTRNTDYYYYYYYYY